MRKNSGGCTIPASKQCILHFIYIDEGNPRYDCREVSEPYFKSHMSYMRKELMKYKEAYAYSEAQIKEIKKIIGEAYLQIRQLYEDVWEVKLNKKGEIKYE